MRNLPKARKQQKHEDLIGRWRLLSHYEPKTILDIGANEGQCAALLHEAFPKARILSFEPLRDCFEIVSAFHQRERCGRAYAFALGNENTKQTIHRNGFTPSSSLLQMQPMHHQEYPQTVESTPEEIQVRRLDDVLSELEIESPLIIKADVQGFEDRVIQGGENTFRMASAAVLEVTSYPLYEDQATFDSINQQLKSLDFVFRGVIDQNISRQDRRILQFDAIFENQAVVS
ncbi:MAG: FkbM family methyltransferase, partial [Planctomycetota bacterium]